MGLLDGKRILLGVTGSIAAYKAAFLVRDFIKQGSEIKVICTPSALEFVTPLTLSTLSKHPVLVDLVDDSAHGVWNNHVELGLWADFFVIAPASANTLAKMCGGEANNLLLTTYLSAKCPVFFAPAMDLDMHAHPANQENIATLSSRGNIEIPSESGFLASGLTGNGRMAEPEHIIQFMNDYLMEKAPLKGKKVLITAGPTQEPIDPVRYIGNRSTGKMGYAIAKVAAYLGADVTLISGPVAIDAPAGVKLVKVSTAQEMLENVTTYSKEYEIAILTAAVADYRPAEVAEEKIKKKSDSLALNLEKTPDILKYLGGIKQANQLLVGFALETQNELENARKKLRAKNCDLIVLNSMKNKGAGFGFDTNQVTLVSHNNNHEIELMSKQQVAVKIFDHILEEFL